MKSRRTSYQRVTTILNDGTIIHGGTAANIHGVVVNRTVDSHPYGYDSHLILRHRENVDKMSGCYSDRLQQWDYKKCAELKKKHVPSTRGDCWRNASGEEIEAFLREYFGYPDLKFIGLEEGANLATGFPYWVFHYVEK